MKPYSLICIGFVTLLAGCGRQNQEVAPSNAVSNDVSQARVTGSSRFEQATDTLASQDADDHETVDSSSRVSSPKGARSQVAPKQTTTTGIAVKGFRLGMAKDDVVTTIEKHDLVISRNVTGISSKSYSGFPITSIVTAKGQNGGTLIAYFGEDHSLLGLEMTGKMVDELFNVGDMTPDAFAQTFIDAYRIPAMEPLVGNRRGWRFVDESTGTEVVIYNGKNLCLVKVPTSKQRQFD